MSTTTDPGRIPSRTPPGPATTASTSGPSETIVMTISDSPATSAGVPPTRAPREARSTVRDRVRLKTVRG